MSVFGKSFENVELADIERLQTSKILEHRTLEYKLLLKIEKGDDRKELLADVTAMANTDGGLIIFGIKEKKEVGEIEIVGMDLNNPDLELQKLEDLIRNGVQPKINCRTKAIQVQNGKTLLLVDIQKNWWIPAMVAYNHTNKFYKRRDTGKYLMDVYELNDAFMYASSIKEQLLAFRDQRVKKVMSEMTITRCFVLHVLPMAYGNLSIDLVSPSNVESIRKHLYFSRGIKFRRNLEGLHVESEQSEKFIISQFFRDGRFEFVTTKPFYERADADSKDWIYGNILEKTVVQCVTKAIQILKSQDINSPVLISLFGLNLETSRIEAYNEYSDPIGRKYVEFPSLLIHSYSENIPLALKPIFDVFFQSGNLDCSPNYSEGKWTYEGQSLA